MGILDYRNVYPPKPTFTEKETPNLAGKVIAIFFHSADLREPEIPSVSSTLNSISVKHRSGHVESQQLASVYTSSSVVN
jgi:hypothetical protein